MMQSIAVLCLQGMPMQPLVHELANSVATPPRIRRATQPTYGSKQRRLEGKSQSCEVKASRSRVDAE
jgi:hypothetical protein